MGYGIEGHDAEKFLRKQGADVAVLDKKFGVDYLDNLKKSDVIVRSPGVYRYLPEIVNAEKNGAVVTSAVKIFFQNCPGKIIGVTGTKGKGTTATLIYEILKVDGCDVYLAGNIGKPYLELLPKLSKKSFVILEMSSFQLIDMDVSPHIAVVLNITVDHLDWHKDREEYVGAKENIIKFQKPGDFAVINFDYETPKSFDSLTKATVIPYSKESLDPEFKKDLLLKGEHNFENIAAAVSVGKILKIPEKKLLKVIRNFKGLEHRLELVGTIDGKTFYNDSFATGPQPTIAAIKSFSEPETLILGGSDKGLDYRELGEIISQQKNVRKVILIGTTGEKIGNFIHRKDLQFEIYNLKFAPMGRIVKKAFDISDKGSVIVLSPASASFDMFTDYKDRGNQFKKAVQSLLNEKKE